MVFKIRDIMSMVLFLGEGVILLYNTNTYLTTIGDNITKYF